MENLKQQIINRLNKILNKYNLAIISRYNFYCKTMSYPYNIVTPNNIDEYILVEFKDNTIIECHYGWDNIEFMLLNSDYTYSIFNRINIAHEKINLYNIYKHNGYASKPSQIYILLDQLYNEFHSLNMCSCLEELVMKMDLMGI